MRPTDSASHPTIERMTRRLLAHAFEEHAGCAEQPTSQMVGYHSLVPGVAEGPGADVVPIGDKVCTGVCLIPQKV